MVGSVATNARGRMVVEAFATLDVALLNQVNPHTFRYAGLGSVVQSHEVETRDYTGCARLYIMCDLGRPTTTQAQLADLVRKKIGNTKRIPWTRSYSETSSYPRCVERAKS